MSNWWIRRLDAPQLRHALRTALVALLTTMPYLFLHLPQGYWAVITGIIVMQGYLGGAVTAGWSRVQGTATGAVVGIVVGSTLNTSNPYALCAAAFIATFICAYLTRVHESFKLAGVTALIILMVGGHEKSYLYLGLLRFLEISFGVVVALLVSYFVLPSRAGKALCETMAKAVENLAILQQAILGGYLGDSYPSAEIAGHIASCRADHDKISQLLKEARKEPDWHVRPLVQAFSHFGHAMKACLVAQDHAASHFAMHLGLHRQLEKTLSALGQAIQASMEELAAALRCGVQPPAPTTVTRVHDALHRAEIDLLEFRKTRAMAGFSIDEVMHFLSFFFHLTSAANAVASMLELLQPDAAVASTDTPS